MLLESGDGRTVGYFFPLWTLCPAGLTVLCDCSGCRRSGAAFLPITLTRWPNLPNAAWRQTGPGIVIGPVRLARPRPWGGRWPAGWASTATATRRRIQARAVEAFEAWFDKVSTQGTLPDLVPLMRSFIETTQIVVGIGHEVSRGRARSHVKVSLP